MNTNRQLSVVDTDGLCLVPLTLEAKNLIYGNRGSQSTRFCDPVELVVRPVGSMPELVFCGQSFYVEMLLGLPLNHAQLAEYTRSFTEFVKQLNRLGELALHDSRIMETRVFVSNDKTVLFMGAVARMTEFTSWKVEFVPSEIHPSAGLDARIIVPY